MAKRVKADVAVNVGGLLTSWNPASHLGYWEDEDIKYLILGMTTGIECGTMET